MIYKTFYVYVLRDPRDRRIKYVGQTATPKRRLQSHMSSIKSANPTAKQLWIIELRSLGLRPLMEIAHQSGDLDEVTRVEQYLINRLVAKGENLCNSDGVKTKQVKKSIYY